MKSARIIDWLIESDKNCPKCVEEDRNPSLYKGTTF